MYIDIVFPNRNEEKFISVAEQLGYSGVCFVYDFSSAEAKKIRQRVDKLNARNKMNIYLGFVANVKDCAKAQNYCELVLLKSSDKNHDNLEKRDFGVLFDVEMNPMRDAMHYRMSGLNQVLCKIAARKKKIIGVNLRNIIDADDKPKIIGRIMQNVMLCRKYKTKMVIFSGACRPLQMKGYSDLISLGVILGFKPDEAKTVLRNTVDRIKLNIKKKSPEYLKEGVEVVK